MKHLDPASLEPDAVLTVAEDSHLESCPRCRIDRRVLAELAAADPADVPGWDVVAPTLNALRSGLTMSLMDGTLADFTPSDHGFADPGFDGTERYDLVGRLGAGGMGEVHRVYDRQLHRHVAMKIASPRLQADARTLARFVEEAQVAAQLQHPGIVPVHDVGTLPDGRTFFTMKEVDGVTLGFAIRDHHAGGSWTLRQLVEVFRRICQAVAFAHDRGVLHRDLKPDNVMLGAFGEVLVLDWGLSRAESDDVQTVRGGQDALATQLGAVAGTPAFMAPEQARGERVSAAADVYALGTILRTILTGRPPFAGLDVAAVLRRVQEGAPPLPEGLPTELADLSEAATARDDRPSASDLARAAGEWLDGARRRERALAALAEAQTLRDAPRALREDAATLRAEATDQLAPLRSHDEDTLKAPAWALQDRADALEAEAELAELRYTEAIRSALTHEADLAEAHAALAAWHRGKHEAAESNEDPSAARHEALLRAHDDGRHARYLSGQGRLRLSSDPPASVVIHRQVDRGRRLVPEESARAETPLDLTLPMGSYTAVVAAAGRVEVCAPFVVPRDADVAIDLPLPGPVPPSDAFVPAGRFRAGGDPKASAGLPGREVWLDGFVINRDPVTHTEYLAFLDALVAAGREDEAIEHAPKERSTRRGAAGGLLVAHEPGVGFTLRPDAEGDVWGADWPAWMVSWHGARRYAAWRAEVDGLPWRLPWELEWEKAARGVDGRAFPWGDFADPTWACVSGSIEGRPSPAAVGAHPRDESVYGVRGLGGNVCDWVLDVFDEEGPAVDPDGRFVPSLREEESNLSRCVKGGSWCNPLTHARGASRDGRHPTDRRWVIGFRLARSLTAD